jgi:hypothetical protein
MRCQRDAIGPGSARPPMHTPIAIDPGGVRPLTYTPIVIERETYETHARARRVARRPATGTLSFSTRPNARTRLRREATTREREKKDEEWSESVRKKNSWSESATKKKEEWSERARRRSWSEPPAATARAACRATAAVRCRRGSRRATDARGRPPNGDGFGGTPKRRPLSRDASCRLTDSSNKIEKKDKKRPSHADWNHHDFAHRLFATSLRDIDQTSNDYISRTTITTNSSLAVWITDNPK